MPPAAFTLRPCTRLAPPPPRAHPHRSLRCLAAGGASRRDERETPPTLAAPAAPTPLAQPEELAGRIAALKESSSRRAAEEEAGAAGEAGAAAPPAEQQPRLNLLQGALAEVPLITWPSPPSVASSTGVVLLTVFVSTLIILAVNAGLSALSEKLFG